MEADCDVTPFTAAEPELPEELQDFRMDIDEALRIATETAPPSTVKGIKAIRLMSEG